MTTAQGDFFLRLNPLFVRCVRARMRPRTLATWSVIVLVVCGFIFAMAFIGGTRLTTRGNVALAVIAPFLALQSFLLLLLGTGACAQGLAHERDVGILDFHRMSPMSARKKILGFLFGLPVREYFLFALTLPFVAAAVAMSNLSTLRVLEFYVVFLSSALLYHLTGMAAGMVSRRARRAGWSAQLMVMLLYFVLPQVGHVGFSTFSHLTYLPTLQHLLADQASGTEFFRGLGLAAPGGIPFYGIELRPALYTLLLQGFASFTFFSIVQRKLADDQNPAFTKTHALAFFGVLTFLLVGSVWPYWTGAAGGKGIFATFARAAMPNFAPTAAALTFFALSLVIATLLLHSTTPTTHAFLRGLRRSRKLKSATVPMAADEAPSLWIAALFILITGSGYAALVTASGGPASGGLLAAGPIAVFALVILEVQGLRTRFAPKGFFLVLAGLWILPAMMLSLILAAGVYHPGVGVLASVSPFWAIYGALSLSFGGAANPFARTYGPEMFIATLALHAILAAVILWRARVYLETWRAKSS